MSRGEKNIRNDRKNERERKTWKGNASETAGRGGSILVMFLSGIKGQSEHCSLEQGRAETGKKGKWETALPWISDISNTI